MVGNPGVCGFGNGMDGCCGLPSSFHTVAVERMFLLASPKTGREGR